MSGIIGSILAGFFKAILRWLARLIGQELIEIRQRAQDDAANQKVIDDIRNAKTLEEAQNAANEMAQRIGSN